MGAFMNKKYLQYTALMLLFTSFNSSFAMENKDKKNGYSWQGLAIGAAIGATYTFWPYLSRKAVASRYEDVSPETQKWATQVLEESGIKDADKIPLKKRKNGGGWAAVNDYFIVIPNDFDPLKCARQKCLGEESILKHEVKHVQNYDRTKRRALQVGVVALGTLIVKEKPAAIVPYIPMSYEINEFYNKYQEKEADRFAYERATSREELEDRKNFFSRHRQSRVDLASEYGVEYVEVVLEYSKGDSSYYDLCKSKGALLYLKSRKSSPEVTADIAEFIGDRRHPSLKSRAAMAQDYIDKWDANHLDKKS
jgi:hypothetical protein